MNKKRWAVMAIVVLAALGVAGYRLRTRPTTATVRGLAQAFVGDTTALPHTQFVATADTPLHAHNNAVWCAALPQAWHELVKINAGPLTLQDGDAVLVESLNKTKPPALPAGEYYSAAGLLEQGIAAAITRAMKQRFPDRAAPNFEGFASNGVLAYCFLQTKLTFPQPYFENEEPLAFADAAGATAPVRSFGLRAEDAGKSLMLRRQVGVLYKSTDSYEKADQHEFAIDLCRSSQPNQLVVAVVPRGASLSSTYQALQEKLRPRAGDIDPESRVLVPSLQWNVTQRCAGVEGTTIAGGRMKGRRIDVARQDIDFRLDRSGVKLTAEAKIGGSKSADEGTPPPPTHYICDRPFFLYLKRRDAPTPFFMMWVDNAELLQAM